MQTEPRTERQIAVAMSGGVDSSVAAALLVQQGYRVRGIMLRLWSEPGPGSENRCCPAQAFEDARRVASALDIPFQVLDCAQAFKAAVVDPFIAAHARGRTPNPCLACNRRVKFGEMLKEVREAGATRLATGHYARIRRTDGSYRLLRGVDPYKDQSYFLHRLGQEQLRQVLFPLGDYTKEEVRALAARWKLPVAHKEESQDICFIRDQDVGRFLRAHAAHILEPGPIVNRQGRELGRHQGLPLYTIGQRRGIGVTWSEPLYVLEKETAHNALVVGPASQLGRQTFLVEEPTFVRGRPPALPAEAGVKIRSTARVVRAWLKAAAHGVLEVETERPLRDVTPGQAAVFYRGEEVLGGGTIVS